MGRKLRIAIVAISVMFTYSGCGVYSLSGISTDYNTMKTISIQPFFSDVNLAPANIGQIFTNTIRDYYQTNTNLSLVTSEGDLQIEGGITGYRFTPVAPQSGGNNQISTAQQTRLMITVSVSYYNTKDDTYNFENRNFNFFKDFDNSQSQTAIQTQLIDEIFEQIVLDIFNASVANW